MELLLDNGLTESALLEGKSSGAIQGSVPRMLPDTVVAALRLDRPMSAIFTTGCSGSRKSPRKFSAFCGIASQCELPISARGDI